MHDRYGETIEEEPPEPEAVLEEPPDVSFEERMDENRVAEDRAWAIANCGLCNDEGERGGFRCDHIDWSEPARRGMAAVRAALERGGS